MITIKRIIQSLMILLSFTFCGAFADVIKNYHVDITVLEDGKIDVIETIEMDIGHQDIRLGIIRDIPRYYYLFQNKIETPVSVLSVKRNGQSENFWLESNSEAVEIFTGAKENLVSNYIPKGRNVYELRWQSENHIRGFMDYDELYFNAIGTSWQFPIEKASAIINLPESVRALHSAGYYGRKGSQRRAIAKDVSSQKVEFLAPNALGQREGLTVATGFTKGIVPSTKGSLGSLIVEKVLSYCPSFISAFHIVVSVIIIIVFAYWCLGYVIYKRVVPKNSRTFMVRFSPPSLPLDLIMALSDRKYAAHMARFSTAFLVDMASKKVIKFIRESRSLKILQFNPSGITDGQKDFLKVLNENSGGKVSYNTYSSHLEKALWKMLSTVSKQGRKVYSSRMLPFNLLGIALLFTLFLVASKVISGLLFAALAFPLMGCAILWTTLIILCSTLKKRKIKDIIIRLVFVGLLLILSVLLGFFPLHLILNWSTGGEQSLFSTGIMICLLMLFLFILKQFGLFTRYIKADYVDLQQEVLEFKHFLQYTKQEEYKIITPELFEEYLTYAIVFGVDTSWVKLYQQLYPKEYEVSLRTEGLIAYDVGASSTFKKAGTAPASSGGSGGSRSSGSRGGGSSGGGSGGGGGRGR